jgi:predicted outer membrane repeat protein
MPDVANCVIATNSAGFVGGAIACHSSDPVITNCTVADNSALTSGGAFYCYQSSASLVNSILWGDTADNGEEITLVLGSALTISFCNVEGGQAAASVDDTSMLNWLDGNMDAEPWFEDVALGDYHLRPVSPCIDAGDSVSEYAGEPQPHGNRVNMGAYGNTAEATKAAHYFDWYFSAAPDIDGNGSKEIVMLGQNKSTGKVLAQVYDAKDGTLTKNVWYGDDGFNPLAVTVVSNLNDNGSPEICFLDRNPSTKWVFGHMRDSLTGDYLWHIWFGPKQAPLSFGTMRDINGNDAPELVLMCRDPDNNKGVAKIYDALSATMINLVWFGPVFDTLGHQIIHDMNANNKPEIVLFGINPENRKVLAHIRDSVTDALVWYVWFGPEYYPIDMKRVPDVNGNGFDELVLLGVNYNTGGVVTKVMDTYIRKAIRVRTHFNGYVPIALEVVPDIDGNGYSELVVIAMDPADGEVYMSMKDARTGDTVATASYGAVHGPWGLTWVPDTDGGGVPELSVLTSDLFGSEIIGKVRDAVTGSTVTDVTFSPSFHPWP